MRELARNAKVILVIIVGAMVVSGVIAVDVVSAAHQYDLAEPVFIHSFPDALCYYNISEAMTQNDFSMRILIPSNHFGQHHLVPRAISLRLWFMDADSEENLSQFIINFHDDLSNSTLALKYERHYGSLSNGQWWSPSLLYVEFSDVPDVNEVQYGVRSGIYLANINGGKFNGDGLFVRADMNITYSRWWFSLPVTESHQIATFSYDLSAGSPIHIYSLEYPYPHLP